MCNDLKEIREAIRAGERVCMKKKNIIVVLMVILIVLFFPVSTTHIISGDGEILTLQKEKIGNCKLEIEISEISSLLICYKKSFSYVLDGKAREEFSTTSYSEADEICFISQMYYDEELDEMNMCSLTFKKDLSYAVLDLGTTYYFINNGSDMTYSELPLYK